MSGCLVSPIDVAECVMDLVFSSEVGCGETSEFGSSMCEVW